MKDIFLVFMGGGSAEPLVGVFSSREAAVRLIEKDNKCFVSRYELDEEASEYRLIY